MTHMQIKLAEAAPMLQRLNLRPLTGNDAAAYFERRNHVLNIGEGHFFSDSYEREQMLKTEQQQREWCTEKQEHCIMGAFVNRELVGFVMITRYGASEDLAVEWEATWVNPRYRRTGLTKALYEKVEQWTVDHGYRFVNSFIREDNKRWLGIRRKLGFVEVGKKYISHWADHTGGNMVVLRRDLYSPLDQARQPVRRFENTESFLERFRTVPVGAVASSGLCVG